jgi:hypothetical protein
MYYSAEFSFTDDGEMVNFAITGRGETTFVFTPVHPGKLLSALRADPRRVGFDWSQEFGFGRSGDKIRWNLENVGNSITVYTPYDPSFDEMLDLLRDGV